MQIEKNKYKIIFKKFNNKSNKLKLKIKYIQIQIKIRLENLKVSRIKYKLILKIIEKLMYVILEYSKTKNKK